MTGAEFVRDVMDRLEVSSPTALAEKMRWKRGMERTVARWLAGTSEPSFAYTIDMATRAGMLALDGLSEAPEDPGRPEAVAGRYARILENQLEALTGQEKIFAELAELRTAFESLLPGGSTSPTRTREPRQ